MGFVASQHLDSVRDIFHVQYFSLIGDELSERYKQTSGAVPKLLLKPVDSPELFSLLNTCRMCCPGEVK
jgi:hypothetical protein